MQPASPCRPLARRAILAGGLISLLPLGWAAAAPLPARLDFTALRNGRKIGEQQMTFETGDGVIARTDVDFVVKLGLIALYRYRHEATERWRDDRFLDLKTRTSDNGRSTRVEALRDGGRVVIAPAAGGALEAAANALPFTHWNRRIGSAPLFNPQDGKLLRETVSMATARTNANNRRETGLVFRGDADITDWYDEAGVWTGLQGRLKDGSLLEYRPI
ncbi:MAG: DUF6134 family protein [Caulobacteraceae bacterium]